MVFTYQNDIGVGISFDMGMRVQGGGGQVEPPRTTYLGTSKELNCRKNTRRLLENFLQHAEQRDHDPMQYTAYVLDFYAAMHFLENEEIRRKELIIEPLSNQR